MEAARGLRIVRDDRDRRLGFTLRQVHELTDAEQRRELGARKCELTDWHPVTRGADRCTDGEVAEDLLRELEDWPRAAVRNGQATDLRFARAELRERSVEACEAGRCLLRFVTRERDALL